MPPGDGFGLMIPGQGNAYFPAAFRKESIPGRTVPQDLPNSSALPIGSFKADPTNQSEFCGSHSDTPNFPKALHRALSTEPRVIASGSQESM